MFKPNYLWLIYKQDLVGFLKAMICFNTYLRTRRDIFKILFKHNWFSVWTDQINLKPPNLKSKNIPINFNTQGPTL